MRFSRHLQATVLAAAGFAAVWSPYIAPASAQLQFSRGNGLVNESAYAIDRENWRQAVDFAEQAIRSGELMFENYPAAYNNLCIGYTGLRKFPDAIAACNKALELKPRHWAFYNNRANIYFYLGQFDRALAEYYKALTFNSGGRVLMSNIGLTLQYRSTHGGSILKDTEQEKGV